ncbi:putative bifunctional diguanylate cyclase/phosphodiesterase [Inhella proteolytica]|uniref:EAL domain-containing protein n=1 Tax=Inhella proteolytica TaxID=2795029 RepID=A0A931NIF8_9BURK|nr:EAL domain-containing protein [Inhella proteolytica]MBH9579301.1 EAL domain-containing protein [Inhella proteolytica]
MNPAKPAARSLSHMAAQNVRRGAALALALALLLVFLAVLGVVQHAQLDQRFQTDLEVQARIVADNAAATVVFETAAEARDILGALRASPAIVEAELRVGAQRRLALYQRADEGPPTLLERWAGETELAVPVRAQRDTVGQLRVRASRAGIWADLLRFVGTATAMLAAALLLAWLASWGLRREVRRAERRTEYLAHYDTLTDLPNRETFRAALEQAAEHSAAQPVAVLVINVDNFKQINENHGHAVGDRLLCELAQRLRGLLRPQDLAARLGGDEFALLLAAPIDEAAARNLAAQLVALLPVPVGELLPTHVSVGVVLLPQHARDASAALRCADAALVQAKRQGKDGFQLYSAELGAAQDARLRLEQDLRAALGSGQLRLVYQPLFDAEGRVQSLEALARWQHPQRGAVAPAEFVTVAESSGLIVELGLHTLGLLAQDLQGWRAQGLEAPPVAINLSSRQCRQPQQRQRLLDTLQRLGLGPQQLEFELTEGTLFEDLEAPDSMVALLQQRGYALAIDDFGTGYSSLSYLRRLRCRKLKIDRLFVHGVARSSEARLLIEAIIRVSQGLAMQVVAEGVEAATDWHCLRELGCDLYQGFGLARPLEAPQALALLQAQAAGARTLIKVPD